MANTKSNSRTRHSRRQPAVAHDDYYTKEAGIVSVARVVLRFLYRILYRPRAFGRANLQGLSIDQPLIFIANHIHQFDAVAVGVETPRNPHYLAKAELFEGKLGWLLKRFKLVRVDRDISGAGIDEALKFLRAGRLVVVFPEGTCNPKYKKDSELLPFKFGAAKMALATDATIVPAAISGKYKFWGRPTIRFGRPLTLDKSKTLTQNNERLRDEILELMKISGVKNPRKIIGKPARNPSKAAPILEK
jgi:1-acyl-sn-glycerol-3-phosphate acyltransferase